jgi:hypothetical protein
MGRYLDLIRTPASAEKSNAVACDTSDRPGPHRGLSSLLSHTGPLIEEKPDAKASTSFASDLQSGHTEAVATSMHASALSTITATKETKATEPVRTAWYDVDEERAAIVEYDADVPRSWAEGYARLDPAHPPTGVPVDRWQSFIDDSGRFLDGGWAKKAASLGWGPLDLFGCDRERCFARIDHAGLLWLLNGDRLVEFDRRMATIERRTGARQTFRRRPVLVEEVGLAWELADSERR